MSAKKMLIFSCIAFTLHAKIYHVINYTPHEKIKVDLEIGGASCKKYTSDETIDQTEHIEVNVPRKCQLQTIKITPLFEKKAKPFILQVDKPSDVKTIAIKQSSDGYKLTYY